MSQQKQGSLFKVNWKDKYTHGGVLRNRRSGRSQRPLSCKDPIHVVFKIHKLHLRQLSLRSHQTFKIVQNIIERYRLKFFIKIDQCSVQNDHIHILIRTSKRSLFHHFFRVVSGQISQQLQKEGLLLCLVTDTPNKKVSLWKHRPFSRIVRGYKAFKVVRDYIQLNEKEALGQIKYTKLRLKGLSSADWKILWG